MSIGSIGSAGLWPSQQTTSAPSNWQNVLNAASGALGLSASALKQQLQSGASLSSIAQSQGVSQQTLVSSISNALTQNGSTATGSQLQQIATNIANRTPGGHHHHPGSAALMNATADPSSSPSPLSPAVGALPSPFSSGSGLANVAAESDLWQGVDLSA